MIRVVLDTNILISALLSSNGPPAQTFLAVLLEPDMDPAVQAHALRAFFTANSAGRSGFQP